MRLINNIFIHRLIHIADKKTTNATFA